MSFLVGIDSGGTHIVAEVMSEDGDALANYQSGPGNIVIDYQETERNITGILKQINEDYPLRECRQLVIGVAGAATAIQRVSQLKQNIATLYSGPVEVMSDAILGLWNVLEGQDGLLVISGTGSTVFAKRELKYERVGGWGFLLGDEGSAFDIARRSLQHLVNATDTQEWTAFDQLFLTETGAENLGLLISWIYRWNRKQIAQLAKITAVLASRNAVAKQIIQHSANALASQVKIMLNRYKLGEPIVVGVAGSVLENNAIFREYFEQSILSKNPNVKFIDTTRNNAFGAYYWSRANGDAASR